jgi:hypothetical protein
MYKEKGVRGPKYRYLLLRLVEAEVAGHSLYCTRVIHTILSLSTYSLSPFHHLFNLLHLEVLL